MAEIDCSRVNELIREINQTDLEIANTLREMERLGFGTAKTLRLMRRVYAFAVKLDALVPGIWGALYEFVRCNDAKLAELTVAQMKQLLEVLQAHAELLIESLDTADPNETPEQKAAREQHLKEARDWLQAINGELANWLDTRGKEATIAALVALKRAVKAALHHRCIDRHLRRRHPDRHCHQVPESQGFHQVGCEVGREVRTRQGSFAGSQPLHQRRAHRLGVARRNRRRAAGRNGATVTAKAFVRCAKIVDGKPQWQPPCPVRIDNGRPAGTASISVRSIATTATRGAGAGTSRRRSCRRRWQTRRA